jgi:hypothetical protein
MDGERGFGLLNIALSDTEDSSGPEVEKPPGNGSSSRTDKLSQSEAAFQAVRSQYKAKVENGEVSASHYLGLVRLISHCCVTWGQIWKAVKLPLATDVLKTQAQELLHAVEELYFFRRYGEAVEFIRKLLGEEGNGGRVDAATTELLRHYESKCLEKVKEAAAYQ